MKATQLNFNLSPAANSYLYYFVPHSGVISQWSLLLQNLQEIKEKEYFFQVYYLHGNKGVGKSYLIQCLKESVNLDFLVFDFANLTQENSEEVVSSFVEQYEKTKSKGGVILIEARLLPKEITNNPHFLSRLNVAQIITLNQPQEEELPALVSSLLERNNLKLKDKDIAYILEHSASDPLSLSIISDRIETLVFKDNVSPKRSLIKEALLKKPEK